MIKKIINIIFNKTKTGSHTLQGRKPTQEDSFYISPVKNKQQLIFVADGVGGHGHGDYASKLCTTIFNQTFNAKQNIQNVEQYLRTTTINVAAEVLKKGQEEPIYKNCGTTISGVFINNEQYYTINVGDSRVYLYNEKLTQLTTDHSIVQQLIQTNQITEEEAKTHPKRRMMTSAIGQPLNMITIDIKGPYNLSKNDIILCVTDGVTEALTNNQIQQIISQTKQKKQISQTLVNQSYNLGSTDNITACHYIH